MLTIAKRLVEKELVKQQRTNFIATWSSSIMKEVGDIFHYNFKVGLRTHPCGYKGVNFGSTTQVQKQAQQPAMARM
jgi:hypothetical protein